MMYEMLIYLAIGLVLAIVYLIYDAKSGKNNEDASTNALGICVGWLMIIVIVIGALIVWLVAVYLFEQLTLFIRKVYGPKS